VIGLRIAAVHTSSAACSRRFLQWESNSHTVSSGGTVALTVHWWDICVCEQQQARVARVPIAVGPRVNSIDEVASSVGRSQPVLGQQ
jgi:hypothetical protein